ncbi:unannotated protein [freshwater metagenome]|uniref:methionyl-tRNA formyltransferase n=1 Tax=freshwater metagenome TaxID=449393 RepID=A0A6J6CA98_9ZZZZ
MLSSMAKNLRLVFAGTPANAARTLADLHSGGFNIVGVLTREDARVGKSRDLSPSPVASVAAGLGLKTRKSNSMGADTLDWLLSLKADLGVVVAYGAIFRSAVLEIPRLGWINLHYSLLPELPGPAPVQHALLKGLSATGVTVFRLDEGIDTGPIVDQMEVAIWQEDNSATLLDRLTTEGSRLLAGSITQGEEAICSATPQDLSTTTSHAYKPTRENARVDFGSSAVDLTNKVRAMNPEPMAWFEHKGAPVRILSARATDESHPVRQAQILDKELVVGCKSGSLVLEVIQPAGKTPMSGSDWFRGMRVEKLELS